MTAWIRRRLNSGDEGYTMLAVLLAFMVVSALALTALATSLNSVGQSRRGQDFRAALAAAQAGVQDYVSRLNTCDTYWDVPCGDATPNLALTGWATVPGTTGSNTAQYSQKVLSNPLSAVTPGVVRLQVSGRVNGVERTIVADLAKTAFLKFLYFSDYETFSPSSTARMSTFVNDTFTTSTNRNYGSITPFAARTGFTYTVLRPTEDQVRQGCERYYYMGRNTFPRTVQWVQSGSTRTAEIWFDSGDTMPSGIALNQFQCLTINFAGSDTIRGPLHTNDAMILNGSIDFQGATSTSWPTRAQDSTVAIPPPDATKLWRNNGGPWTPRSNLPVYAPRQEMPPTNLNIRKMADAALGGAGCLYTGPTSIEFLNNGKIKVKSPYTRSANPGCIGATPSTVTTVDGPSNGVIYVQDVPASSSDPNYRAPCGSAEPLSEFTSGTGDPAGTYDCMRGDVFVKGTVKGKFTVASARDVIVVGNTVYDGGLSSTNVLGLVAQNNVAVYHPYNETVRLSNLRIDAAIASVTNSFTVQNYDRGSSLGDLTVNGVIVQKFRGPVGTSGGSGYDKDYVYDTRLTALPPPSFLELQYDAWSSSGFSEEDS